MDNDFKAFQKFIESNSIGLSNDGLNKLFNSYKFNYIIDQNQINYDIISKINNSQIIMIDIFERSKVNYFIFGFEKTILIVKKSEINIIQSLFSNINVLICFMTKKVMDCLQNFKILHKKQTNFNTIITSFSNKLNLWSKDQSVVTFWNSIRKCICGYLIEKCIIDCNENRIKKYNQISKLKTSEKADRQKELQPFEYQEISFFKNGSVSILFLAYHVDEGKLVIIKKPGDDNGRVLERENSNYCSIEHPLLSKYYGFCIQKDYICIQKDNICIQKDYICPVYEYINGNTLVEIKEMNLTNFDKIKIIFELIMIIHYLHSHNFIYRDLKPDNIMIDQNKTLILIDFDRMISNVESQRTTTVIGNAIYVAPEILLNSNNITNKVDIYSLGKMILYIILNENPENDDIFQNFPIFFSPIEKLCLKCINENNPNTRPSISDVLYYFYIEFLKNIKQFNDQSDEWKLLIQILENDQNDSKTFLTLGYIYFDNILVPIDIKKSIHYFKLAADQGETESLKKLMQIYWNGLYIERDINKGIYYMSLMAEKGDAKAQYFLGCVYIQNMEVRPNIDKAIYYFKLAVEHDFFAANYLLGKLYLQKGEITKSIKYLTFAANNNDQAAQYLLGKIYSKDKYHNLNINKAIKYFMQLANNSICPSLAQYQLGKLYSRSKYINHDFKKAIYYYTLAANQNDVKSQYHLGKLYFDKENNFYDITKSIFYLSLAADNNDEVNSQYILGLIYLENKYVYDIKKAIRYFTLAANHDHLSAQEMLGSIYSDNKYLSMNIEFAVHYLSLAAKKNSPFAQALLGSIYLKGNCAKQNADKIIHYFTLSANQNFTMAQFILGSLYYEGQIVQQDLNKSIFYLKLAADKNLVDAQNNLGLLYRDSIRDPNKALHYLLLAAKQNCAYALNNLGEMYKDGNLVPKDISRAIYYYTISANQNDCIALNSLGNIYSEEIYKRIDIIKAIHYFSLAADQNCSASLYNLGIIYLEGKHTQKDINKAIYYFTRASKLYNYDAILNLSYIYLFEIRKQDINKAIQYATIASRSNCAKAQLLLGFIYLSEKFQRQDIKKAIEYFKLSAKNRNIDAYHPLGFLYHEGKYISKNINLAISNYKEASSFNNRFSKNNLGVIYKRGDGVEKNISNAIIFFEEALRVKNDPISSYNLAHIYFYGEDVNADFEKSMVLLLKSFDNYFFIPNIILLSLIIVKKANLISLEQIRNEINHYNCNKAEELCLVVFRFIQIYRLEDSVYYDDLYFKYIDINFLYNIYLQPVISEKNKSNVFTDVDFSNKIKTINENFYNGLGDLK